MSYLDYLAIVLCTSLALGIWRYRKASRLAPGPPAGLFGNARQFSGPPWIALKRFADQYGPMICLWKFNKETIFLNDYATANALLDYRSSIYSSRPTVWMVSRLAGRGDSIFHTKSASPRFRIFRTLLHKTLNPRAIQAFRSAQVAECQILLRGLLEAPDKFILHARRNAVALIMSIAYGYRVQSNDDRFISVLEDSLKLALTLRIPGKFWVEFLPFLRHIPEWFPGSGFKKLALNIGRKLRSLETMPFDWAKSQVADGSYTDSFVSDHINDKNFARTDEEREDILRSCAAALYVGGGDTTVSVMTTFFLLMARHPNIQRCAQDEIDSILGSGEMATHEHQSSLPYVNAMIKEILRWGPTVPLGLPHEVTQDDFFNGYFIRQETQIVANIWAMSRDENVYPNPETFDPTRFLGENQQLDPFNIVFGFGRRICPGMHFAEASLFVNITNILANFVISKKQGADGCEIEPEACWSIGTISHLKPFPCQVTPRTPNMLQSLLDNVKSS